MTSREKFMSTLNCELGCPPPDWEFAYWFDTIQRWYAEGLPRISPPERQPNSQWVAGEACPGPDVFQPESHYGVDVSSYFGSDERIHAVALEMGPIPAFEEHVLDETEDSLTYRRGDGKTVTTRKDGTSMPHFLSYPVTNEAEFSEIKQRFSAQSSGRFPAQWGQLLSGYKGRTYPLVLGAGSFCGFYSILRELMGLEESLFAFYDNPRFVMQILEYFTNYYIELYSQALLEVEVDYVLIWEDLSFKNGPLVSPAVFEEFLLPCYTRLTDAMRSLGVRHFIVDTDGNFEVLIPLFLRGGVTGFYPFEVAAGMELEKIRKQYPRLAILGGIDKRALAGGRREIDVELQKVARMLPQGGYVPYTDHMVPPDVDFASYRYYRSGLREAVADAS